MYMYMYTSNETIQFMVKFVDNNYRTFQKERRAKGKRASIYESMLIQSLIWD